MSDITFDIKRSVRFFLERRRDNQGNLIVQNVPIRMSVSFGGKRVMFYAGYRVDTDKWDIGRQRVKKNTTHANNVTHFQINERLDALSSGINSFFKVCEVRRTMPTIQELKDEFNRIANDRPIQSQSLFTVYGEFVTTVGKENNWSTDTYIKFSVIKNHLLGFDRNLTFEKFDGNAILRYVDYLRTIRGMRNSTIKKSLSFVRWFLRWAQLRKYPVQESAVELQIKLKGTDATFKKVIFLNLNELKYLFSLEIPEDKSYLRRVRDVFVFCCFTGLRYSDVYNLKKFDDKGDYIEFVTQKTNERLKIELNKFSRAILDKYSHVPLPLGKALPVITNQKMNEYLKELGKLAGMDSPETVVYFRGNERIEETKPKFEFLTTHCARKTFVTNLIYLGVSDHVIRQWTGHKDLKSFEVYHKIVDEIKVREMAKFNEI